MSRSVTRPRSRRREVYLPVPTSDDLRENVQTVEEPPLHELMSAEVNVQRIMRTGSFWFVGAVVSVGVVMGLLLSSGWRPASLPEGPQALWWLASLAVTVSIGLIGWSGCPILEVSVPVADRNKTHTMQIGTAMFIVGSAAALFAVMLGPAL